jgi:GT2 family glycosyltransferase
MRQRELAAGAVSSTSTDPLVSVVVPTFNRRAQLERVLTALAEQDLEEPFEVVVVSDGSTDGTDDYLTSGETPRPVVVERQENAGPAAARNRGVTAASAPLIVFLDDDVVPVRSLLSAHLAAHRRLGDGHVVIGPMVDPPDHPMSMWVEWEQAMLAKQYRAMTNGDYDATARQFYTGNASVARDAIAAAGGFDARFRRGEDVELAYRLAEHGLRFVFEPTAVGLHYAERGYDSWRSTAYEYGRTDVVCSRQPGREWMTSFMSEKYRRKHPLLRRVVEAAVPRPRAAAALTSAMRLAAATAHRLGLRRVSRYALSAIYGIEYNRGVVAELGDVESFRRRVWGGLP